MVEIKVPGLEKLVDYTASGVGSVAGSMLAPWKARREAQASLIAAQTQAEVSAIQAAGQSNALHTIAKAQAEARQQLVSPDTARQVKLTIAETVTQRIEFQEEKRQKNIGAVVDQAATEIGDKEILDHEPDHDWTARFFSEVQDVSSEDMQVLWARILAGEVEAPGSTSIRTLSILRNMARRDAELFVRLCGFCWDTGMITPLIYDTTSKIYTSNGINFNAVGHLESLGLIRLVDLGSIVRKNIPKTAQIFYYGRPLVLTFPNESGNDLDIGQSALTQAGRELAPICGSTPVAGFFEYVYDRWAAKSLVPPRENSE